jgi:parallel beta-helix repeat protein
MGRYCLHFHVMGDCPDCLLRGNAIDDAHFYGVSVHGTHRATVEDNVMYNVRGVGIYIEDGNEMNNTIKNNVITCELVHICQVSF